MKSRFTDEQIVRIVREVDAGATWAEVTRRHGISRETLRRCTARSCSREQTHMYPNSRRVGYIRVCSPD